MHDWWGELALFVVLGAIALLAAIPFLVADRAKERKEP
jgi:hypothetical protein